MIQLRCAHCNADVSLSETVVGNTAPCPNCGQPIAIAAVNAAIPPPQRGPRIPPAALHACGYAVLTAISIVGWFTPKGPEMVGPAYVRNQFHDVVTANRIQVVDGKGDLRIMLSAHDDGGKITVFDKMGARFAVVVEAGKVSANLSDAKFNNRIASSVDDEGNPRLVVSDAAGDARVELSSQPDGRSAVVLYDEDGKFAKGLSVE